MFYLTQVFGLIALIILISSFQQNNKKKLLKYQIFSSVFFSVYYLLLNATTGFLVNAMNVIRNIMFSKLGKKIPIFYSGIVVSFFIVMSIVFYDGLISLLPFIATIMYTIVISQKNLTITRIVVLITCLLSIIYNIEMSAVTALIASILEFTSVVISIYRFDIKKKKRRKK